jgi:hypothetical protein
MNKLFAKTIFSCLLLLPVVLQAQGRQPNTFALDGAVLAANKNLVTSGNERLKPAYKQLLKDADKALEFGPVSVMEKTQVPPSGNKHDFMSLAPYHWPDPTKPDGLPYIRKDGETNPEVNEYKDKDYLPRLCESVHVLALAYYFSGNQAYANHAATLLRVWFLDTATRMNPNLNFAQAMKGHNTGRGSGLIDTRHFIKAIDAVCLLKDAPAWKPADQKGMQQWMAEFLNWMQTSKNGTDEMNAKNNHGVWYDAQRLSMALFTGNSQVAAQVVANVEKRIDSQMDDQGFFPAELARTMSLHYSVFVMEPLCTLAQMATHAKANLWNYKSPSGKSLQKGFDALQPYITRQKPWTGQQIREYDYKNVIPLLAYGRQRFGCTGCGAAITAIGGDNADNLRIHLLTKSDL